MVCGAWPTADTIWVIETPRASDLHRAVAVPGTVKPTNQQAHVEALGVPGARTDRPSPAELWVAHWLTSTREAWPPPGGVHRRAARPQTFLCRLQPECLVESLRGAGVRVARQAEQAFPAVELVVVAERG
jgi:hypothetical protein